MPLTNEEIEEAIAQASEAMDKDPTLKGAEAARWYNAIYSRLMARRKGRPSSNMRGGQNKKLSEPQDHALKDYLLMLHWAGTSANMD